MLCKIKGLNTSKFHCLFLAGFQCYSKNSYSNNGKINNFTEKRWNQRCKDFHKNIILKSNTKFQAEHMNKSCKYNVTV